MPRISRLLSEFTATHKFPYLSGGTVAAAGLIGGGAGALATRKDDPKLGAGLGVLLGLGAAVGIPKALKAWTDFDIATTRSLLKSKKWWEKLPLQHQPGWYKQQWKMQKAEKELKKVLPKKTPVIFTGSTVQRLAASPNADIDVHIPYTRENITALKKFVSERGRSFSPGYADPGMKGPTHRLFASSVNIGGVPVDINISDTKLIDIHRKAHSRIDKWPESTKQEIRSMKKLLKDRPLSYGRYKQVAVIKPAYKGLQDIDTYYTPAGKAMIGTTAVGGLTLTGLGFSSRKP